MYLSDKHKTPGEFNNPSLIQLQLTMRLLFSVFHMKHYILFSKDQRTINATFLHSWNMLITFQLKKYVSFLKRQNCKKTYAFTNQPRFHFLSLLYLTLTFPSHKDVYLRNRNYSCYITLTENRQRLPLGHLALMITQLLFKQKTRNPWANQQLRSVQPDIRNTVIDTRKHLFRLWLH